MEPAKLGCAVLAGPHTFNFATAYEEIFRAQGTGLVHTAGEIADLANTLLADPAKARALGEAASASAETLSGAVAKTVTVVEKLLADARA